MRTSVFSRSVIAVASLAIGSAALAATPATAATASDVTRDLVLTAVNGVRLTDPTEEQFTAAVKATQRIAVRACDVDAELNEFVIIDEWHPFSSGDNADGILIRAEVVNFGAYGSRECTIAALTAADPAYQLNGSVSISGVSDDAEPVAQTLRTGVLSGNVFVTAPIDTRDYDDLTASASGIATKTTSVTTSQTIAVPKTTAQKKTAKKTYDRQLKAAKNSYNKAVKKAGKNKNKKATAKKKYNAKRSTAKKAYNAAIATTSKIVSSTTSSTDSRPFSITTVDPEA